MTTRQRSAPAPLAFNVSMKPSIESDPIIQFVFEAIEAGDITPVIRELRELTTERDQLQKRLESAEKMLRLNSEVSDEG